MNTWKTPTLQGTYKGVSNSPSQFMLSTDNYASMAYDIAVNNKLLTHRSPSVINDQWWFPVVIICLKNKPGIVCWVKAEISSVNLQLNLLESNRNKKSESNSADSNNCSWGVGLNSQSEVTSLQNSNIQFAEKRKSVTRLTYLIWSKHSVRERVMTTPWNRKCVRTKTSLQKIQKSCKLSRSSTPNGPAWLSTQCVHVLCYVSMLDSKLLNMFFFQPNFRSRECQNYNETHWLWIHYLNGQCTDIITDSHWSVWWWYDPKTKIDETSDLIYIITPKKT